MKIIGLCGGSGSGKGLVCSLFNEIGIKCIDTDKIYHEMITLDSECTLELISYFGEQISGNPGINRQALRKIAFANDENLKKLNEITHKHILKSIRNDIEKIKREKSTSGIIIDAPLLFESGFDKECDLTVAVIADNETRLERIILRDGISRENAMARISSQIPNDMLIFKCDYVIENNSDVAELKKNVYKLAEIIFDNKI